MNRKKTRTNKDFELIRVVRCSWVLKPGSSSYRVLQYIHRAIRELGGPTRCLINKENTELTYLSYIKSKQKALKVFDEICARNPARAALHRQLDGGREWVIAARWCCLPSRKPLAWKRKCQRS